MPRSNGFVAALVVLVAACTDQPAGPAVLQDHPELAVRANSGALPPSLVRTVSFGSSSLGVWPYLGEDVSGTASDPVSLLFTGRADPRSIRAALMSLDGDRSAFGFPNSAPFDCRWTDTPSGGIQAGWTDEGGWIGSAIQLGCGDFGPVRFHLRLLRSGKWTIGGVHFEVLIPGTADHQVLSWELAEQLVTVDMMRTGLLAQDAPVRPSDVISAAPTFRTIPAIIFNSLPPSLQALAAGAPGNSATDVPIANDGRATMFNIASAAAIVPDHVQRTFTLTYGQVIPKPFCGGPQDYVYVQGPLTLTEDVVVNAAGRLSSSFHAGGQLAVTPINPLTGQPAGATFLADISESHIALIGDDRQKVSGDKSQVMQPANASGHGSLAQSIDVDSYLNQAAAVTNVTCTP